MPPYLIRSLNSDDVESLYHCFNEAFSDYFIKFNMSLEAFRQKLVKDGADLRFCAAAFCDDKMIGFIINGIDYWEGEKTAYNGGTGVIPSERGKGLSREIYEYCFPLFKEAGIKQCLLEVIVKNEPAIRVYKELGFQIIRQLECIKAELDKISIDRIAADVIIREARVHDWSLYKSFWDIKPSWPWTPEAIYRSLNPKFIFEAVLDNKIVGYCCYVPNSGNLAQIAVHTSFRRLGIGNKLLSEAKAKAITPVISIINIDNKSPETLDFFYNRGFINIFPQYEMIKKLI